MVSSNDMKLAIVFCLLCQLPRLSSSKELQRPQADNDKLVKVECYSIDWEIRFCIAMTAERIRTYSKVKYYCYHDSELLGKLENALIQFKKEGKCLGSGQLDVELSRFAAHFCCS